VRQSFRPNEEEDGKAYGKEEAQIQEDCESVQSWGDIYMPSMSA